ncbi:MAG: EPS-associated MarR family transcriptional regulator [Candidatus Azotimanducaceae bacterium]
MKTLEADPKISQRQLAENLDISLGKVNYCVKALLGKGLIKATNFKNSNNKIAYAYLLTPKGIKQKTVLAQHFLERKVLEYEQLENEIKTLKAELQQTPYPKGSAGHPLSDGGSTKP